MVVDVEPRGLLSALVLRLAVGKMLVPQVVRLYNQIVKNYLQAAEDPYPQLPHTKANQPTACTRRCSPARSTDPARSGRATGRADCRRRRSRGRRSATVCAGRSLERRPHRSATPVSVRDTCRTARSELGSAVSQLPRLQGNLWQSGRVYARKRTAKPVTSSSM